MWNEDGAAVEVEDEEKKKEGKTIKYSCVFRVRAKGENAQPL